MRDKTLKYSLIALGLCAALSIGLNIYGLSGINKHSSRAAKSISMQKREMRSEINALKEDIKIVWNIQCFGLIIAKSREALNAYAELNALHQEAINNREKELDVLRDSLIRLALIEMTDLNKSLKDGIDDILSAITARSKAVNEKEVEYKNEKATIDKEIKRWKKEIEDATKEIQTLQNSSGGSTKTDDAPQNE